MGTTGTQIACFISTAAGTLAIGFVFGWILGFIKGIQVTSWLTELDARGGIEALIERRRAKEYGAADSLPRYTEESGGAFSSQIEPPGQME